jgi:hypothetical protein
MHGMAMYRYLEPVNHHIIIPCATCDRGSLIRSALQPRHVPLDHPRLTASSNISKAPGLRSGT